MKNKPAAQAADADPSGFRISIQILTSLFFYDWKLHLPPLGRGGAVKIFSQTITELINLFMTKVFVEQPLASPGSANNIHIWSENKEKQRLIKRIPSIWYIYLKKRKYALHYLLENRTLKLFIWSLLCIGDFVNWRFCYLEVWRFPSFLETPGLF